MENVREENERKKEYLKSYRRVIRRERDILSEIQRLRADKMFPSVVNDGMPKGNTQSDLSDYIVALDEQIDLLKRERLEKVTIYKDIEMRIRAMENSDEQEVLRYRYISGMKWDAITEKMGYSWRQIHRIHSSALLNFKMA